MRPTRSVPAAPGALVSRGGPRSRAPALPERSTGSARHRNVVPLDELRDVVGDGRELAECHAKPTRCATFWTGC